MPSIGNFLGGLHNTTHFPRLCDRFYQGVKTRGRQCVHHDQRLLSLAVIQ